MGIEWNEAYKIGHAELDKQHQHLFELASALTAASGPPNVRKLLMQLYKHSREHFELEEALMRKVNFPDTIPHTESHNSLLLTLNVVSKDVGQGKVDGLAIEQLMTGWLNHILRDDAKITTFIAAQV